MIFQIFMGFLLGIMTPFYIPDLLNRTEFPFYLEQLIKTTINTHTTNRKDNEQLKTIEDKVSILVENISIIDMNVTKLLQRIHEITHESVFVSDKEKGRASP
tara:strand:+ start:538 stop:843 length:306 start_codon:yes stop_codon:yes gene_type:complete